MSTLVVPKNFFEPDPGPKISSEGRIKNKNRGPYFCTINHPFQGFFFKISILGFVDAPVMCILFTIVFCLEGCKSSFFSAVFLWIILLFLLDIIFVFDTSFFFEASSFFVCGPPFFSLEHLFLFVEPP